MNALRGILIPFLMALSLAAFADKFEVCARYGTSVQPTTDFEQEPLFMLEQGTIVEGVELDNTWEGGENDPVWVEVTYEGQVGYILLDDLVRADENAVQAQADSDIQGETATGDISSGDAYEEMWQNDAGPSQTERPQGVMQNIMAFFETASTLIPWSHPANTQMTQALLIIALVVWLSMCRSSNGREIHVILGVVMNAGILAYVGYMGSNSLWFLDVDKAGGLGWLVLHAVLMLFMIMEQFFVLWMTVDRIQCKYAMSEHPANLVLGLVSLAVYFVAMFVCVLFAPKFLLWLTIAFVVAELVQVVLLLRSSNAWYAFAYALCIAAGVLLLLPLAIIAVVGSVVILGMYIVAWLNASEASMQPAAPEPEPEEVYDMILEDKNGSKVETAYHAHNMRRDKYGTLYEKQNDGSYKQL